MQASVLERMIPAMTTDAERECYYRLAKEGAGKGAIVELGAWLGASTAYIAAGIKDSGAEVKAQVYDRFKSDPSHARKVKAFYKRNGEQNIPLGSCFDEFKNNLGELLKFVEPHQGEIADIKWGGEPISVLITDAPKRVPQISAVLTEFRKALQPGSVMAWQDFCHFPSYEIPACLYLIRDRIEFVEAVVPGTTLVFRVKSQWVAEEVSPDALALDRWSIGEIEDLYDHWLEVVPIEKVALFECGAAMFCCDIGHPQAGVEWLGQVFNRNPDAIIPKWRYLKRERGDFLTRYAPLFEYLEAQGAL